LDGFPKQQEVRDFNILLMFTLRIRILLPGVYYGKEEAENMK
jgi:hypothetical protein